MTAKTRLLMTYEGAAIARCNQITQGFELFSPPTVFTFQFLRLFASENLIPEGMRFESESLLAEKNPRAIADAEWLVRTIKEGCLERMIFFGEDGLRKAVREFVAHYLERKHQGLYNRLLMAAESTAERLERCRFVVDSEEC